MYSTSGYIKDMESTTRTTKGTTMSQKCLRISRDLFAVALLLTVCGAVVTGLAVAGVAGVAVVGAIATAE
jgi:hypothetical protein